jgi:hypothetical protein
MASVQTPQPTDPDSTAQNYSGMSRMAGSDNEDSPSGQTSGPSGQDNDPSKALANMTNTIRECEERIMSVAGSNPRVAKEVRDVRGALRKLMAAIVSNPGGSEPPAPRTGL